MRVEGPVVEMTLRNGAVHRTSAVETDTGNRLTAAEVVRKVVTSDSEFILLSLDYAIRCSEIVMVRVLDDMDA